MVSSKRGVSVKDLRPFSVEDPLGQNHARGAGAGAPWRPPTAAERRRASRARAGDAVPTLAPSQAAAKIARVGCLMVMALWGLGFVASAAAWLPELIAKARPLLERLVEELSERPTEVEPPAPDPPVSAPPVVDTQAPAAPPELEPPVSPPPATVDAPLDVCLRTERCCLVVQGERGRSICANFRRVPVPSACQQAYDAFAEVGASMGRRCE